jgi:hypothetical protein
MTIRFICFETGLTTGARYQVGELEYFGEAGDPGGGTGQAFRVTEVVYDPTTDQITMTWPSSPGKTYSVFASVDLVDFGLEIDDGVASGGTETTFTFPNPSPGAERIFFRVQEN